MKKIMKQTLRSLLAILATLSLLSAASAQEPPKSRIETLGPQFEAQAIEEAPDRHQPPRGGDTLARIRFWNQAMLKANSLDHTPARPGENRVFGEQLGPARTSRAFAIVHIAIFDAVNAIVGGYRSYTGIPRARFGASVDAAIAQAAHDTLVAVYPSQAPIFDRLLVTDLREIPDGRAKTDGIATGRAAAAAILAMRRNDGSDHLEPCVVLPCPTGGGLYPTSDDPGRWRQDPISMNPLALGAFWGRVTPFVMNSGSQFRAPLPPALTSAEYTAAFNEVKRLGGDGVITPTLRNAAQTIVGTYWAYDATPGLGAPPRLYNQIAVHIATQKGTNAVGLARLLALVNVAMGDAGIAVRDSKFFYEFWRPVTGIREDDGNPATVADPNFTPLGAPASNTTGPDFTPPFPAYPSGHATFGAAMFQTLRRFYGTDRIPFSFVSDEFNGVTRDNDGSRRPRIVRSFSSLSQAEEENGQSRIYLGIHWAFDKTEGIAQGRRVANFVFDNSFTPVR